MGNTEELLQDIKSELSLVSGFAEESAQNTADIKKLLENLQREIQALRNDVRQIR